MFTTVDHPDAALDALELSLEQSERLIRQLRARQLQALRELDAGQIAARDGARSIQDWVAARLDVDPEGARVLVEASRLLVDHPGMEAGLADGDVSFDRALATAKVAALRGGERLLEAAAGRDIAGVRRLIARHRRTTRRSERDAHDDQFVAVQPSLDESIWRIWGQLAAIEGRILDQALTVRSEALPEPISAESRARRNAHALVTIAQDSLDGCPESGTPTSAEPIATVFVEAALADASRGERGAEIAAGPPVGPQILERILCEGRVQVVAVDDLKPVRASRAVRAIPPAVRRFVLGRDGGCVVDGCSSRYRLQPHHVVPFAEGGSHDSNNLATLCWYHHHVAVHGSGFTLDPESPPQRRKLLPPPRHGPDPPSNALSAKCRLLTTDYFP